MLELISNADVYAPAPLGRCHLVVGGGRILWIGTARPDIPAELLGRETDLAGRRLIPGLVDGHVHLTGGGGESGPASRVPPLTLSDFTRGGVTSAVGVLGTDDVTRSTGGLVAAARGLVAQGLSAWCYTGGYHVPPVTLTGSVRDDIVFIDRILGVGEVAISDHRSSQPSLGELLRLAAEAHVAGMLASKAGLLHLHLGDGPRGLEMVRRALDVSELPPRVFYPTHVNRRRALFEEALELAGRGCTIDVTAFPVGPDEDAWTAEAALGRYLDTDLPREHITVSSDAGGSLPVFDAQGQVVSMDVGSPSALARALRALLAEGRELAEVLPAFTANPARILRLAGKGRIEAGADADLVVLGPDAEVVDVMVGGRWFVKGEKPQVLGVFETGRGED